MTQETNYSTYIGKQVCKRRSGKPFKSGEKINTVKGIVNHPQLNVPAFTFVEDESYDQDTIVVPPICSPN